MRTFRKIRNIVAMAATAVTSVAMIAGMAYGAVSNETASGPQSVTVSSIPYVPSNVQQPLPVQLPPVNDTAMSAPMAIVYHVKSGDTLSSISKHVYGKAEDWPLIYWNNHSKIKYANIIYTGQNLTIPAKTSHIPAPPRILAPVTPAPAPAVVESVSSTQDSPHTTAYTSVNPADFSGFESCVISRESGGNSQVMNSSGHYGLFQFSESTWEEYGGAASMFGNASPAYQEQIFDNAMAQNGEYNWGPYDGC